MIETPCRFEQNFSGDELRKIGQFTLRWSYIEHTVANCLRVLLSMESKPATVMVFPLSLHERMVRIGKLDEFQPMPPEAKALYNELTPLIIGMQYVRNATIHGVFVDFLADEPFWHLRSKNRELTEAQLVSCEELINYTAHVAEAFRISLGGKEAERDPLPPKDDPGRFVSP